MKIKILIPLIPLFFLSLPLSGSPEKESISQVSLQAEALWEAQGYEGAQALYEQLLAQPLPPWQQARLQYNLGTIRLAQHQTTEAIDEFQKIAPGQLSLPASAKIYFSMKESPICNMGKNFPQIPLSTISRGSIFSKV